MRKFLKNVLLVIGLIVTVGGAVWLAVELLVPLKNLWTAANANKSNKESYIDNPAAMIAIAAAAVLIGALLTGIGIGMSRLTFKQQLQAKQDEDAMEAQEAAAKAAAKAAARVAQKAEKDAPQPVQQQVQQPPLQPPAPPQDPQYIPPAQ